MKSVNLFVFLLFVKIFMYPMLGYANCNNDTIFTIYVNNKQVPISYFVENQDSLEFMGGYNTARDAVYFSGGKFQKGNTYLYRTKRPIPKEELPSASTNQFRIVGTIPSDFNDETIKLFQMYGDSAVASVDFTKIKDGKFYFEGEENIRDYAILTVGETPKIYSVELVLERGDIFVSFADSLKTVQGTYLNDLHSSLRQSLAEQRDRHNTFCRTSTDLAKNKESAIALDSYIMTLMRTYAENVVGQRFIQDFKGYLPADSLQILYQELEKRYANNPWLTMSDIVYKRKVEQSFEEQNSQIGNQYVDFELITPDGEKKRISDYVGQSNYLLIDFWASWCGPCIAEIPTIKEAYEKYKDKGFDVLSISLDYQKNSWLKALNKVDMPWAQLGLIAESDEKKLQEAYHFNGIPHVILINKNGVVVAVNLRGPLLEHVLQQLLK